MNMNKVKMFFTGIVFVTVFELLHSYRNRLLELKEITAIQRIGIYNLKIPYCLLVAFLIASLVYLVIYRKNIDLEKLQEDYVRSRLNQGVLENIDCCDEAYKHEFYRERIESFTYEQHQDCLQYMQNHLPKSNGMKRNVLLVLNIIGLILTFSPIYIQYRQVKEIQRENLALIEDTYNQIIEEEYIKIQNLPLIHIVGNSKLKVGDVQRYLNEFVKTQPQFMLNNCHQINLCEPKKFDKYAAKNDVDMNNDGYGVYAFASRDDLSITLQVDPDEYNDQAGIVTHELAHIYDYTHFSKSTMTSPVINWDWIHLYKSVPECLGDYGSTDPCEFFAEATQMYVHEPEELQDTNMDIYNYLNNLYKMYK